MGRDRVIRYTCEACGGEFFSDRPQEELDAEAAAFAHHRDEMAEVCESCFEDMRAGIPEMDDDLRRAGL